MKAAEERHRESCGGGRGRVVFTHTFGGGDVNGAGDVGEALVHAHLQVDDPANTGGHGSTKLVTGGIHTHTHTQTQPPHPLVHNHFG